MSTKTKASVLSAHPDLKAIADAIPHGTGSDLSTHELLILCHLPIKQRHPKATDVFTPWNCLRMAYEQLKHVEEDALEAAHLPRSKIPPTTKERSGWNKVPKHAKEKTDTKEKAEDGKAEIGKVAFGRSPPQLKQKQAAPRQMGGGYQHFQAYGQSNAGRTVSTPVSAVQVNASANRGIPVQDNAMLSYMNHTSGQVMHSGGVSLPGPQALVVPSFSQQQSSSTVQNFIDPRLEMKENNERYYKEGFMSGYEKGWQEGYEKGLKQGWEDAQAEEDEEVEAIDSVLEDEDEDNSEMDDNDDDDDDAIEDMDESGDYEP